MSIKYYKKPPRNKAEAISRANHLRDHMIAKTGGKWQTRVWQNIGWHYGVKLGTMSLFYFVDTQSFNAMISKDKNTFGVSSATWHRSGIFPAIKDPVVALKDEMSHSENAVLKLVDVINANRKSIGLREYGITGIYSASLQKRIDQLHELKDRAHKNAAAQARKQSQGVKVKVSSAHWENIAAGYGREIKQMIGR